MGKLILIQFNSLLNVSNAIESIDWVRYEKKKWYEAHPKQINTIIDTVQWIEIKRLKGEEKLLLLNNRNICYAEKIRILTAWKMKNKVKKSR